MSETIQIEVDKQEWEAQSQLVRQIAESENPVTRSVLKSILAKRVARMHGYSEDTQAKI